ncbi:MAG: hypothetical protein ABF449_09400 [Ethanoligenens sp.]
MDLLILLIGTILLVISAVFKLDALFMATFLVATFNDFIRTAMIQKKQDERAVLIKSKADGLTYFIVFGLLVVMLGVSVKRPEFFPSIPQVLSIIITAICLIHSLTLSIFQRKY